MFLLFSKTAMKPDQHKKKRSAQYKRKHGKSDKKETAKDTNATKVPAAHAQVKSGCSKPEQQTGGLPSSKVPQTKALTQEQDEAEEVRIFSRRKIESNWSRYDDDLLGDGEEEVGQAGPRGADYATLLSQTGDVSSQFRFKDEQIWEDEQTDYSAQQGPDEGVPAVDCHCLAQQLRTIPLPVRLGIDPSFFEVSMLQSMEEAASQHREAWNGARRSEQTTFGDSSQAFPIGSQQVLSSPGGGPLEVLVDDNEEEEEEDREGTRVDIQDLSRPLSPPQVEEDGLLLPAPHSNVRATVTTLPTPDASCHDPASSSAESVAADGGQRSPCSGREGAQASAEPLEESTTALADAAQRVEDGGHRPGTLPKSAGGINGAPTDQPVGAKPESVSNGKVGPCGTSDPSPGTGLQAGIQLGKSWSPGPRPGPGERVNPTAVPTASPALPADPDDEELDFLLSLENPVQARGTTVSNASRAEAGLEEEEEEEEGVDRPTSRQEETDQKQNPKPVETLSKTENGAESLEDWLDSVL